MTGGRGPAPVGHLPAEADVLVGAERPMADTMGRLKSLLKEKQFETALAEAQEALGGQPRHVGILSAAASAAFSLGDNQLALQYIRRALYLQPDSDVLKDSLGKIQRRIEESGETP